MTRAAYIFIIAVLAAIIVGLLIGYKAKVDELRSTGSDSTHFTEMRKVMVLKAQAETRADEEKRRLMADNQRTLDSTDRVNAGLLKENKRLRGLIRPVSVVMSGDTAGIREQLVYRDQAIENCDSSLLVRSGELTQARAFCDSLQAIEAQHDKDQETAINALNDAAWDNAARAEKYRRKASQNVVISIGAGVNATTQGLQYGPQITVGYNIVGFRIGKR